jgi:hypothetical protein
MGDRLPGPRVRPSTSALAAVTAAVSVADRNLAHYHNRSSQKTHPHSAKPVRPHHLSPPRPTRQRQHAYHIPFKEGRAAPATAARSWLAALCALSMALINRQSLYLSSTQSAMRALHNALLYDSSLVQQIHPLSMHIFASPKPFVGIDNENQLRALESWLALDPQPIVTFLGSATGYRDIVRRYGLDWVADIDSNFLGVPLFNAVLLAANESTADIIILANADIVLFEDLTYTLRKIIRDLNQPWMAVGARWDISDLPYDDLAFHGPRYRPPESQRRKLSRHARENGSLHTYGGIDLWAWNTNAGAGALYDGIMPHFVFGRGKYDNWLTHEVIAAGHRIVIDVSNACTLIHVKHDYHLVDELSGQNVTSEASNPTFFWNQGAKAKFELYINTYLAAAHGSYNNQMGTILHAPYKMQSCHEADGICLIYRRRPHSCRCEHSSFVQRAQNDPFAIRDSRIVFCGLQSSDSSTMLTSRDSEMLRKFAISGETAKVVSRESEYILPQGVSQLTESLHGAVIEITISNSDKENRRPDPSTSAFGLPLVLQPLLDVIEHRTKSRSIVLTTLSSNEKGLLMRFVCAARAAGVFSYLVIAALDDEMYHFAITRGLPVYLEESLFISPAEQSAAMRMSQGLQLSPLIVSFRLRIARRLLALGREVFYVNPDILLMKNPIAYAKSNIPQRVDVSFMSHNESVSIAMFLARPSAESLKILSSMSDLTSQQDVLMSIKCDAEGICKEPGGSPVWLFPQKTFRTVTSSIDVPAKAESISLVAIHLAIPATSGTFLDIWRNTACHFDFYDDVTGLCRR